MLELLTCTRGHFWEVASESGITAGAANCPQCGAPAESLPLLDFAPADEAPPPVPLAQPVAAHFDSAGRPVLAGYDVQEPLGRALSGVALYRARQPLIPRVVLLKVVSARDDPGQRAWGHLRGEATALARLQHPHIVQIHEAGERDRQLFYNVVEHVPGPPLAELVRDRPLPFSQVARLMQALALAVDHAHERGIVHRNLKPSSVLLQPLELAEREAARKPLDQPPAGCSLYERTYVPKLTDFGLAHKPLEGDVNDLDLYGDEAGFLSPEQAWGRAKEIGPAADVYGLGAILFFLLTGRAPFGGRDAQEIVDAIQTGKTTFPKEARSRVPAGLDAICRKCLSSQPHRRYASARDLAEDLRRCAANLPLRGRPCSASQRFGLWLRRRPALAALLLLACLTGAGMLTAYLVGADTGAGLSRQLDAARRDRDSSSTRAAELAARVQALQRQKELADYVRLLREAEALIDRGLVDSARATLERCSNHLRHWEWYHLQRCLRDPKPVVLPELPAPAVALAFNPLDRNVLAVAWSPRGEAPPARGGVRLFEVRERPRQTFSLKDFEGPVYALAFRPDGQRLATAASDGADGTAQLRTWSLDAEEGAVVDVSKDLVLTRLTDVAYSDGTFLLAASSDGTLHKFRAATLQSEIAQFGTRDWQPNRSATRLAVASDGQMVAALNVETNQATVWDARTGQYLFRVFGDVKAIAFAGRTRLAVAQTDNTVRIWNATTRREEHRLEAGALVERLAFSADGARLGAALSNDKVRVWGWGGVSWEETGTLNASGRAGLAFSGNSLLATANDKAVRVWGSIAD